MFLLYNFLTESRGREAHCSAKADSPLCVGLGKIEEEIRKAEERYSSVYLDLLGLIAMGHYKPGDRLPSHTELQKIYGVSIDTTMKAIQILQNWGVVITKRGQGIFVAMDLEALKKIQISPEQVASHVRRFLDSLELLTLTVEGVAEHAASHTAAGEAQELYDRLEYQWKEDYLYELSPIAILDFILEHIQYEALRVIYRVVRKNFHIGRSIPKLVTRQKNERTCEIHRQCMEAVKLLKEGHAAEFAKKAAGMYRYTQQEIIAECMTLGYWEAAMAAYDGSALWK